MTTPSLPEIKESDATGETAALYDDIRAVIGVPMVNLLFRHMATVPGCLHWAWSTIRPLYINAKIPNAAAALTSRVLPGQKVDLSGPLNEAALSSDDKSAIERVLDAYGRANPMNLIGLKIIDLALDQRPQSENLSSSNPLSDKDLKVDHTLEALLPMADLETAPKDVRAALHELAVQIHGGDTGVVPSLYRHFGQWPTFLRSLKLNLASVLEGPDFETAAQDMKGAGEEQAERFYFTLPLPDLEPPNVETAQALKRLIAQFPPNICRMTVLATVLRRGL